MRARRRFSMTGLEDLRCSAALRGLSGVRLALAGAPAIGEALGFPGVSAAMVRPAPPRAGWSAPPGTTGERRARGDPRPSGGSCPQARARLRPLPYLRPRRRGVCEPGSAFFPTLAPANRRPRSSPARCQSRLGSRRGLRGRQRLAGPPRPRPAPTPRGPRPGEPAPPAAARAEQRAGRGRWGRTGTGTPEAGRSLGGRSPAQGAGSRGGTELGLAAREAGKEYPQWRRVRRRRGVGEPRSRASSLPPPALPLVPFGLCSVSEFDPTPAPPPGVPPSGVRPGARRARESLGNHRAGPAGRRAAAEDGEGAHGSPRGAGPVMARAGQDHEEQDVRVTRASW